MDVLSAPQLAQWLADSGRPAPQLLDVREPWEIAQCVLPGSITIPMGEVPARVDEIDTERPVVCICHHGMRSLRVAMFLESRGHGQVLNLDGGIDDWARSVDPAFPTY